MDIARIMLYLLTKNATEIICDCTATNVAYTRWLVICEQVTVLSIITELCSLTFLLFIVSAKTCWTK